MAYLLEYGLRRVETERPELANDSRYLELKEQLLRDAEGHFREIQATYATILKTQCHCGGQLEPVDHEFGKSGGTIYDSVIAKCKSCGEAQAFQFPKEGFISEARSAMALRDYGFLVHLPKSPADRVLYLAQTGLITVILDV